MSPFRVPKGLEVFFQQWFTVAPWDFDVVNSVDRAVYCRSGCLVCKLIAVNVLVSRDPVELNVDRLLQKTECTLYKLNTLLFIIIIFTPLKRVVHTKSISLSI